MMIKPELNPLFNFPVCFHPTTVIFIDDEPAFLEILSAQLSDRLAVQCFNEPAVALDYTKTKHHLSPFRKRCWSKDRNDNLILNFEAIRKEMYNNNRFNEILINVTDYDMPFINGIEVTKTMEFNSDIPRYAHIFLTGKVSNNFKEMVKNKDYVGKDDPCFIDYLLNLINDKATILFSNYSYEVVLKLARDPKEKAVVLLDGDFCSVFNSCIIKNNICEYYIFDKQGSYIMLDADANPSWLFIRNETGMKNSIRFAKERHAPQEIIDALESRKFLLSIYGKTDINNQREINWNDYLLPSQQFESDGKYFQSYADLVTEALSVYYYAHSKNFGGKEIDKSSLMSYRDFLNQKD